PEAPARAHQGQPVHRHGARCHALHGRGAHRHRARAQRRRLQAQGAGVRLQPHSRVCVARFVRRRAAGARRQRHALPRPRGPGARRARQHRRHRAAEPPAGASLRRLPRPLRLGEPRPPDPVADRVMSDTAWSQRLQPQRLDALDCGLVVLFLVGLYLGVAIQITEKVPLTCAPSGFAGLWMLWRRRNEIRQSHLAGLLLVLLVYLGSILSADNINWLGKRTTGLLQLTYSLVIAYGMFLTLVRAERSQIAAILHTFCLFIITGCALETWGGLRPISDFVRGKLYNTAYVYDADLRDEILYGRVRPKLFTSEPSAVTFAYTHYCAVWLAVSAWRYKYLAYVGLLGLAIVVLPGPTLMLMLLLATPYVMFLAGGERRTSPSRMIGALVISCLVVVVAYVGGQVLFAERLHALQAGKDASFFYRFTGPMLVALDMFKHHP